MEKLGAGRWGGVRRGCGSGNGWGCLNVFSWPVDIPSIAGRWFLGEPEEWSVVLSSKDTREILKLANTCTLHLYYSHDFY